MTMASPFPIHHRFPGPPEAADEFPDAVPVRSERMIRAFVTEPGKVFLLYGDRFVFHLSLRMAAQAMMGGNPIVVVDGGNRFDVHALSRFARQHRVDPTEFLNRIFISRGFTCYQMEQALIHRLPAFLKKVHSRTALVFGLLDTFYDEQAPLREVREILRRLLASFQEMRLAGTSILVACLERSVAPRERNNLFAALKHGVDRVYKLDTDESGSLQLFLESRQPERLPLASHSSAKGEQTYGTDSADLHQRDRRGAGKLVKIPARAPQRRPGSVR
jgi:hypothetical protein